MSDGCCSSLSEPIFCATEPDDRRRAAIARWMVHALSPVDALGASVGSCVMRLRGGISFYSPLSRPTDCWHALPARAFAGGLFSFARCVSPFRHRRVCACTCTSPNCALLRPPGVPQARLKPLELFGSSAVCGRVENSAGLGQRRHEPSPWLTTTTGIQTQPGRTA